MRRGPSGSGHHSRPVLHFCLLVVIVVSAVLACSEVGAPKLFDDPLLPPTSRIVAIATGFSSACGLTEVGRMYCWGENRFGELGDSSLTPRPAPIPVHSESTFATITGTQGTSRSCAVTPGGTGYCWGYNLN